jgi:Fe-S cluster assembly protein SufD
MTIVTENSLLKDIVDSFKSFHTNDLKTNRENSLAQLEKIGLPSGKSEEYRFTPITKILEKKFKWNHSTTASTLSSIDPFLISGLDATVIVLVNGKYSQEISTIGLLNEGVVVTAFKEATSAAKAIIETQLGKVAKSDDSFALLNNSFWQEGIFIHVPANTIVDKPILILHVNDAQHQQVISHTRLLAIAEKGSQVSIIEKSDSIGELPCLHTFIEEIIVKDQATFDYCKIQNDPGEIHQVSNTTILQSNSSKVNTFTLTLNGKLIRNNLSIIIDGEQCESHFHGLYLLKGNTLADNHTVVDHQKPNSFSNELYKGIMDENSKGVFNGKIYVRPQAQKTNAFQSNRNILMSESATINTKPQLEIWADDVKCSHGCTTGQLDEEALFYLQTRGIPHDAAKAMLLYAFALDVLASIKNESLKVYLDKLISERLHKNS